MLRKQCKKCPWKKSVNPHDIPDGYSEQKHINLKATITTGSALEQLSPAGPNKVMACHETPLGGEQPCVGWLVNQLGPGNNIPLRIACMNGSIDTGVELDGEQHKTFEDTLP